MDSLDKKYYKIREVADFLGVQPSTLRFWESRFTLIKPRRNGHGTRFYTPADIEVIRMIYYLVKERGLKLEAAEEEIRRNRTGISRKYEAVERLKQMRERLQSMMDALDARAAVLRRATRQAVEAAHAAKAAEASRAELSAETDVSDNLTYVPEAFAENDQMSVAVEEAPVSVTQNFDTSDDATSLRQQPKKRRRHWTPDEDMPSLF